LEEKDSKRKEKATDCVLKEEIFLQQASKDN